jgi:hypothetical protein
MLPEEIKDRSL